MNAPVSLPALRRRHWSALAAAALLGGAGLPLRAAGRTLPLSVSLPDELAQALAGRQPLVVMVSLHRCPWCEEVRNNYLAPMREREGLPVVQVDMRSEQGTRTVQGAGTVFGSFGRAAVTGISAVGQALGPGLSAAWSGLRSQISGAATAFTSVLGGAATATRPATVT